MQVASLSIVIFFFAFFSGGHGRASPRRILSWTNRSRCLPCRISLVLILSAPFAQPLSYGNVFTQVIKVVAGNEHRYIHKHTHTHIHVCLHMCVCIPLAVCEFLLVSVYQIRTHKAIISQGFYVIWLHPNQPGFETSCFTTQQRLRLKLSGTPRTYSNYSAKITWST